jgi:tetratricopeptide (TPR) repeat protein
MRVDAMKVLPRVAVALACAAATLGASPEAARAPVVRIVTLIQKADYEGDRSTLRRLYEELAPYTDSKELASRVRYWRGFARWRRALNGFNESADPTELEPDLELCVSEFEQATAKDPAFVDAKVGAASCLTSLAFLNQANAERRQGYVKQFVRLLTEAKKSAPDNPRLLWVLGTSSWYAPPERGGQAKALDTFERGLQAARSQKGSVSDPLEPSWGEPELLMNLAWANLNRATPDLDAADANAKAALALVPNWHYVRDILLPQIREARAKQPPVRPSPSANDR